MDTDMLGYLFEDKWFHGNLTICQEAFLGIHYALGNLQQGIVAQLKAGK